MTHSVTPRGMVAIGILALAAGSAMMDGISAGLLTVGVALVLWGLFEAAVAS